MAENVSTDICIEKLHFFSTPRRPFSILMYSCMQQLLCWVHYTGEVVQCISRRYLMLYGSTSISLLFIILNEEMSNDYEQRHQRSSLFHCVSICVFCNEKMLTSTNPFWHPTHTYTHTLSLSLYLCVCI